MQPPVGLALARLVPPPDLFTHPSVVHGQAHVARVMVHALRLIATTGWLAEAPRLWAAVYLHDLARTHDGRCHRHGVDAMRKLDSMPEVRELFSAGGVVETDYGAIHTAVVHHCLPEELVPSHPHWRLTSLLKDADGLDRVRLSDLDPQFLRNSEARAMVSFAHALYDATWGRIPIGDGHFEELWARAAALTEGNDA